MANLWHRAHYNAIAKDIRDELALAGSDRPAALIKRTQLSILAIRFAKRFKLDNEAFDPLKFLDQCSDDVDRYPLSELWEEDADIST